MEKKSFNKDIHLPAEKSKRHKQEGGVNSSLSKMQILSPVISTRRRTKRMHQYKL